MYIMKHLFLLFSSLALFSVMSCKSQKNDQIFSGPQPTKDSTIYKGVTNNACALELAFGSYSAGIDRKGYDNITKYIESQNLASTSKVIGREGETRICLPLTEVKDKKKNEIIEELKKLVKQSYLTSISIR